ncbi:hypothetical protein [Pueribacillus theae]|nr:hypothetical protein [Pueribacillus theae]
MASNVIIILLDRKTRQKVLVPDERRELASKEWSLAKNPAK